MRALEAMAKSGIEYAEQPVPTDDLEAMAWLVRHAPLRVAADESACSVAQALRVLEAGAAHVLVLKPMSLGGLVPTLDLVRRASARDVPCVITTTIDAAIARTGALHAAAAAMGLMAEPHLAFGLATGPWLAEDVLEDAPAPGRGAIALPRVPGLGLNARQARLFRDAGIR
jgi:L-alanine-DL-glutamate epimerase-like enolase superfamily enzyme